MQLKQCRSEFATHLFHKVSICVCMRLQVYCVSVYYTLSFIVKDYRIQWNPSNVDTNGTHSTVRNIEASVFRRLPVIFMSALQ